MNKQRQSQWGRLVTLLFVFFQFIQFLPFNYFAMTASASSKETFFSDENGTGEAEWDLSEDGKTLTWNVTVSKSASETDTAPYFEITPAKGTESPVIQTATLNGTDMTGASFQQKDHTYIYHADHFIPDEQILKLTFTMTVTNLSSPSLQFQLGGGITSPDASPTVSSTTLTLPNRLAQIEVDRLAAEEAAKKAEEERLAAEEAAKKEAEEQAKDSSEEVSDSSEQPKEEVVDSSETPEEETVDSSEQPSTPVEEENKEDTETVDTSQDKEDEKEPAGESTKSEEDPAEEEPSEEESRYMEGSSKIPYTGGPVTEDGVQATGPQPVQLKYKAAVYARMASQIDYTTNKWGTFPASYNQHGPHVRNYKSQPVPYEEGTLKKTAVETDTPGKFEVTLEVEGKSITETESTDVVLVLDNSNSMADNDRVTVASNAAKQFINGLLNTQTNPTGAIRMALVTYGSEVFTNRTHTELTTNSRSLTSKLPSAANNGTKGGTFTQAALRQARTILDGSNAANKIIIVLSDGLPTLSYKIEEGTEVTESPRLVNYHNLPDFYTHKGTVMDYNSIKGDGTGYYLDGWGTHGSYRFVVGWEYIWGLPIRRKFSTASDHFLPTMSEALLAKQKGMTLYGVGIELTDQRANNGFASRNQALNVLKNIATDNHHYYDADDVSKIQKILQQLSHNVTKSISNGTITDPMGEQILLDKGPNNSFDSKDYTLEASDSNLLDGVTVSANEDDTIQVKGLNLGKDEWVRVKYNARLNTEDPNFKPGFYYQTNGRTTLTPVANTPDLKRDFPIPSVKAPGWTLEGEKIWENDIPEDRPETIEVTLSRRSEGTDQTHQVKFLTVTSDRNGEWSFIFDSLPRFDNRGRPFLYSIKETPIPGYQSTVTPVAQDPQNADKLSVTVTNTLPKGEFVLQKVDGSGNPITGSDRTAQFELRKDGKVIRTAETNPETGQIVFSDLKSGTYTIRETQPPAGYEGDPKEVTVEIKQNQNGEVRAYADGKVLSQEAPLLFVNHLKKGSLTIEKKDAADGEALPEAVFELRNADGEVTGTGTTNSDGKILWENIPFGEYTLVETKAPDGYMLQEQEFSVTIGDDAPHVTLTVENHLSAELPSTGGMGTTLFTLIGLALMGTTLYGFKKNKHKDKL